MMRQHVLMSALVSMAVLLFSGFTQAQQDVPILIVGEDTVYTSEFEYVFNKNRDNPYVEEKTPQEYMDLFVQFKLKVYEAERLGLDTSSKFIRELAGYREQLARPYLIDSEVTEHLIDEVFDRYQTEVEASHILFQVSPNASPEDTATAYQRAIEAREKILAGADFDSIARKYSQDPSAAENGGRIGYFSALYLVYPFENAAFNMKVGEISMPVRTRYGYHIIQVTDRRPARGEVKVAHIMIRLEEGASETVQQAAAEKIQSISNELKAGADFSELARVYSDDKTTSANGGELRWFGSNVMVEPFDLAAFALEEIGEISEPVLTQFGWHIIKLLDKKGPPTRETAEADVRRKIQRDSRSELSTMAVMERLKKEYSYQRDERGWAAFQTHIDSRIADAKWKAPTFKRDRALFKLDGNSYYSSQFAAYLEAQQSPKNRPESVGTWVNARYNDWVHDVITQYENSRLEDKYEDFRLLYKEYREGILLFDLMEQEVWKKAVSDTAGLEAFHANHLNDFMWEKRLDVDLFSFTDEKGASKFHKKLSKTGDADKWYASFSEKDALRIQRTTGVFEWSELDWIGSMPSVEPGVQAPLSWQGRFLVPFIREVLEPMPKTLAEARGQITAAYQEHLEKALVTRLKSETKVEIIQEALDRVE